MRNFRLAAFTVLVFIQAVAVNMAFGQDGPLKFRKHVLTTDFIAEGVAVGDVNRDGKLDILAGTHWFEAPKWKKHDITVPQKFKTTEYSQSFMHYAVDVNHDGWIDLIRIGFPGEPATWYENPGKKKGYWPEHSIYHSVGNESAAMYDIDGDGSLDLLCNDSENKKVVWLSAPQGNDTSWTEHVISTDTVRGTHRYTHGLGFGDINLDGRADVIIREGWWEAPEDRKQTEWTYHPADLGEKCAHMFVRDLDGDGDSDVLSSSAHDYGIWWHEQKKEGDDIKWIEHEIFMGFSQSHGLVLEDLNEDGHPDLITGKRYYAHNGHDPGANEPAVLYWFEYQPGTEPKWIPHLIDNNSGAGLNFVVEDINKDKLKDIVISNKKGVYIFEQIRIRK